ncbi:hypothetical protein ACC806_03625 [Rhizobium ruizarguesonis]
MARKTTSEGSDLDLGVMDRLTALLTLFTAWSKTGVPPGVKYPTSLNKARTWTNADFGIVAAIGSKRDIATTHVVYGTTVEKLAKAIKSLRPAKVAKKRVPKTAKAKTVAAENDRNDYKVRLEGVTKQLIQKEYQLEVLERDLFAERQRSQDLRTENGRLHERISQLTRDLAVKSGGLKVVN